MTCRARSIHRATTKLAAAFALLHLVAEAEFLGTIGFSDLDLDLPGAEPDASDGLPERAQQFLVGARFHTAMTAGKLFAAAAVGLMHADFGDDSETGGAYLVALGIEVQVSEMVALTPYVSWTDAFSIDRRDAGAIAFGIRGTLQLAEKWDVLAVAETNDNQRWKFGAGLAWRF